MTEKEYSVNICHLYPDHLNLYGDRGNIIALKKRCEWRGINISVENIGPGESFDSNRYDIVFLGGGQDFDQSVVYRDLIENKKQEIKKAVDNGTVFLCICGGYQMMGQYYKDSSGNKMECLGIVPVITEASKKRLIGNIVCESNELSERGNDPVLVGFENHSGRTYLKADALPLAKVISGFGNNGEDKTEGARYNNVYCTYMHGSFLPKNPDMADLLIQKALERKYSGVVQLEQLEDEIENNARKCAQTCKKYLD